MSQVHNEQIFIHSPPMPSDFILVMDIGGPNIMRWRIVDIQLRKNTDLIYLKAQLKTVFPSAIQIRDDVDVLSLVLSLYGCMFMPLVGYGWPILDVSYNLLFGINSARNTYNLSTLLSLQHLLSLSFDFAYFYFPYLRKSRTFDLIRDEAI